MKRHLMVRFEFVTIGKTSRDFSSLLWTKKDFQRTILALILLVIDLLPRNKHNKNVVFKILDIKL